jgi:hypothetical protein
MTANELQNRNEQTKLLLGQLNDYARDHNMSNRQLAGEVGAPYDTFRKWWMFSRGKNAREPSKEHLAEIREFLEAKNRPEIYSQIKEAGHRVEKIKYLLLVLEDELRWFRDSGPKARHEFRKRLDASDIGYISSLLTMLTDEDKFNRWLALTTTQFRSFSKR